MSLRNEICQNKNDFNIQIANLKNEFLEAELSILAKQYEFKIINSDLKIHITALEKELNIMQLQLMDAAAQIEKHEAENNLLKSQVNKFDNDSIYKNHTKTQNKFKALLGRTKHK